MQLLQYYLDEHVWVARGAINTKGHNAVQCMIMRKVIRLTEATAKNYDNGQINGVKNDFNRTVCITEFTNAISTPIVFIYTAYRLLSIVGYMAVYGIVVVAAVV